ncbi:MAG TPA: class I SAM-dependent methyltransferase [Micromonosporaceae bacterium]
MSESTSGGRYVLDNDEPTAVAMLDCLSGVLDELTTARLREAGVPVGGRCLEIGAGNGSIAAWLADRVGIAGEVIATDVKPQHVRPHPRVEVLTHDICVDPLPEGQFDVIHARLVLAHLPARREILGRLVQALAPGGALLVEEWGARPGAVLAASDPDAAELYTRYQQALLDVFAAWGNDSGWAASVPRVMLAAGLVAVDTTAHARSWTGGTAGCRLPIAVSSELHEHLVNAGMPASDLVRLRELLADPTLVLLGNLTYSTLGRRPR